MCECLTKVWADCGTCPVSVMATVKTRVVGLGLSEAKRLLTKGLLTKRLLSPKRLKSSVTRIPTSNRCNLRRFGTKLSRTPILLPQTELGQRPSFRRPKFLFILRIVRYLVGFVFFNCRPTGRTLDGKTGIALLRLFSEALAFSSSRLTTARLPSSK